VNQRVGIDVQANIQGVQQATQTTAQGVDKIGRSADQATAKIKRLEESVRIMIQRLDQLNKTAGRGFSIPGGAPPGSPASSTPAGPGLPGIPAPASQPPARIPSSLQHLPSAGGRGSGYGYNFSRFAHSGLHQGLNGLGQMSGTSGITSMISGGLRYGLLGAGIAGIGAGVAGLVHGHDLATRESHPIDFLKRQLGDVGVNFSGLRDLNRDSARGYGINSIESADYARRFAKAGNLRGMDGLGGELKNAYGFSRSYGMDPGAGVGFFGAMRGVRVTIDETSSKKLAMTLAESIEKGGNSAQAEEVMAALQQFGTMHARSTLSHPNMEAMAGSISALTRLRLPGLDASGAASMLMQADQAMRGGGARGEASLNVGYGALSRSNPGISAFGAKALMGLGLFGTGEDLAASPWGQATGYKGGGRTTNFDAVRGMLQKHYGNNPEVMMASMQGFFGLNEQQSAVMAKMSPDQLGGIESLTKRRGIDFGKINSSGMQSLAGVAGAKTVADLVPFIRSVSGRKDVSDTDKKALKDALDTGEVGKTQDVLTDILAKADQEMTDGKKSLEVQKSMDSAMAKLGENLIPATNSIRDYMGRLVNHFAPQSDEARAYQADRQKAKDMADYEDALKKQVERGEIELGTADAILGKGTGFSPLPAATAPGAGLGAFSSKQVADKARLAMGRTQWDTDFAGAAEKYGLTVGDLKLRAAIESSMQANATNPSGAKGLMQFMPGTAAENGVSDPMDAKQSIYGGARFYAGLLKKFRGNKYLADKAYMGRGPDADQYAQNSAAVRAAMGVKTEDIDPGSTGRRATQGNGGQNINVNSSVDVTLRDKNHNPIAPVAVTSRRVPVPSGT
jgi:hypothetical protein